MLPSLPVEDTRMSNALSAWRTFRHRAVAILRLWYAVHASVVEAACLGVAFSTFLTAVFFTLYNRSALDFSSILTVGGGLQSLAFTCLSLKVRSSGSIDGISARSLWLYVFVFSFRLSSTLHKNGYLPVDKTGDWLYQLSDIVSLALVLLLLGRIDRMRSKYRSDVDVFPVGSLFPACVFLAFFTFGDLNRAPLWDFFWMLGMWFDTFAMVPQMFVMAREGGKVPALLSHYVAAVFASRLSCFVFWFYGFPEAAPADGGLNICGAAIVCAHGLQLLLSGDFMYHYIRSIAKNEALVLPEQIDV